MLGKLKIRIDYNLPNICDEKNNKENIKENCYISKKNWINRMMEKYNKFYL